MRWVMLILNLLAAVGFYSLFCVAIAAHRTHAFSTYRTLVNNHALVDRPTFTTGKPMDVEKELRGIAAGGEWYKLIGYLVVGACLVNGILFFYFLSPRNAFRPIEDSN